MNTQALYYDDGNLARFSARVTACFPCGAGFGVELDRTAFYPGGGGQACDTGFLGTAAVTEVWEQEDKILHLCDGPLEVGSIQEGVLDWAPRFSRMQHHTGEHMLSGAIHRRFGYHNVGFHMGNGNVTVDFDGVIPAEALPELEREVNRQIWQDLPVKAWFPEPAELEQIPYRSKRALEGPVRVVQIPDSDSCACCGIHVARTGQVGLLKILSCVKFHQGVRLEICCGEAAMEALCAVWEQNRQVSQAFSVPVWETGSAAVKMNEALANEKFRYTQLEKRLFRQISENFADKGNTVLFEAGLTSVGVRELAECVSALCGGFAAVFSGEEGAYSYCIAQPGGDVAPVCDKMHQALGGKGGGKPAFRQGRIPATEAAIRAFFADFP